jgi:cytochrome c oxidase subunit 4
MTMSSDTTTADTAGAGDETTDGLHSHEVSDRQYVIIALLLAALTAAEVVVSYTDIGALLVPVLLVMMAVKFMTIVGYFMHLKHDAPLFKLMFYIGLVLAISVFGVMLATFHFFIT